ncbi:hypothetical protein EH183_30360 [Streptomyces sp. CB01881]|nr:hypothetical protein EH183_30360 [Streptomyces sp. CB01881]
MSVSSETRTSRTLTRSPPPSASPGGRFSTTTRLSNSAVPRGTWLQPWICVSGVCSNSRNSTSDDCNSRNHGPTAARPSRRTRTGSVLMNRPTIDSIPGN